MTKDQTIPELEPITDDDWARCLQENIYRLAVVDGFSQFRFRRIVVRAPRSYEVEPDEDKAERMPGIFLSEDHLLVLFVTEFTKGESRLVYKGVLPLMADDGVSYRSAKEIASSMWHEMSHTRAARLESGRHQRAN